MSEVNRYVVDCNRLWKGGQLKNEVDISVVLSADFDRVTAERDAALRQLGTTTADRDAEKLMKAKARIQRDVQTAKAADLQERLTAADERADVLEGLLREVQKSARKQDWANGYPTLFASVDAALKPGQTLSDFAQRQEPGSGPGPRYTFHAGVPMSSASTEYSPQTLKAGGFVASTPAEGGGDA